MQGTSEGVKYTQSRSFFPSAKCHTGKASYRQWAHLEDAVAGSIHVFAAGHNEK
jgi:hypothetical protein